MMMTVACAVFSAVTLFVANHDQRDSHRVVHEIVGKTNYVYDAGGKLELVRGEAVAFCVKKCANVVIRNVRLDWERPSMTECRVLGFERGVTRVSIDRKRYPFVIDGGRLLMTGEGWTNCVAKAKLYDGCTREHLPGVGDLSFDGAAREGEGETVELLRDFSTCGAGLKVDDIIVLRPKLRDVPAIVVTDSRDVTLEDVVVHDAKGMALIAQHSENVTWRGTHSADRRTSGVFPREGSFASTHADATHFANVRGEVVVENCWFEGMMDDAINVHSTCLSVTNVIDRRTIRCRFAHPQTVGLDLFAAGERLRFLRGANMSVGPERTIVEVRRLDARVFELVLAEDLPSDWGVGDAVENADWQPRATFRGNVVCNNRARGAVFATPHPVRVESNVFSRVSGTALLFPGDARYWYESGACRDVQVRRNVFSNCCTCAQFHGKSYGVISIAPNVGDFSSFREGYHRGIVIEDNKFVNFPYPLIFASAADDLKIRNNRREFLGCDWEMPEMVFRHCRRVSVDGRDVSGSEQGAVIFPSAGISSLKELLGVPGWPRDNRAPLFVRPCRSAESLKDCRFVSVRTADSGEDLSVADDRNLHRKKVVLAAGSDYGSDGYCATTAIGGRVPLKPDDSARSVRTWWLLADLCEDLNAAEFENYEAQDSETRQHSQFRGGTDVWANRSAEPWKVAGVTLPKNGFYGRNADVEAGIVLKDGKVRAFSRNRKFQTLFVDACSHGEYDFGGIVTSGAVKFEWSDDWEWKLTPVPGQGSFEVRVDPRAFGRRDGLRRVQMAADGSPSFIRFRLPRRIEDLQQRIDSASAQGGGRIVVPPGEWESRPLVLKSNVTLHLSEGATLYASTNISEYSAARGERVFLFAENAENVAVDGKGVLDGRGYAFEESRPLIGQSQPQDLPVLMRFSRCRNVRLEDFTYRRSGAWGCHLRNNDGVVVRRLTCVNHTNKTNDGIDCESSNVLIEDCDFDTDDDAVCLKTESDLNFEVTNVVVRNCRLASCCNGFKVGSGSWCPVRDVLVENCRVERPCRDWRFQWWNMTAGVTNRLTANTAINLGVVDGGSLENLTIRNLTFSGVRVPLSIRLGRRNVNANFPESFLRNVLIENVKGEAESHFASPITGLARLRPREIVLRNLDFTYPGGAQEVSKPVPEREAGFPGPYMFSNHPFPAFGFYLRHADGITFENVTVRTRSPDPRPAVVTDDCQDVSGCVSH